MTAKPLLADVGPILEDVWREIRAAPFGGCAFDAGRVSTLRRIADRLERAVTERIWEELAKEEDEK